LFIKCSARTSRKRRSLYQSDLVRDDEETLAFTSWDTRENSTFAEKPCYTFKATTDFVNGTIQEFTSFLYGEKVAKSRDSPLRRFYICKYNYHSYCFFDYIY